MNYQRTHYDVYICTIWKISIFIQNANAGRKGSNLDRKKSSLSPLLKRQACPYLLQVGSGDDQISSYC